jgi:hypothetical protein
MIGRTANTALRRSRQQVRPPRKVCPFCFEADHIGGHNHIPHLTVEICQFHHASLTEQRLAGGAEMKKQASAIKTIEMALRSLAITADAITGAMEKLREAMEFCAEKLKSVCENGCGEGDQDHR